MKFPTRILSNSSITIDNIFTNKFKYDNFSVYPLVNGLSDRGVGVLIISSIIIQDPRNLFHLSRTFDNYSITDFKFHLSYEIWKDVFTENNVSIIFNTPYLLQGAESFLRS